MAHRIITNSIESSSTPNENIIIHGGTFSLFGSTCNVVIDGGILRAHGHNCNITIKNKAQVFIIGNKCKCIFYGGSLDIRGDNCTCVNYTKKKFTVTGRHYIEIPKKLNDPHTQTTQTVQNTEQSLIQRTPSSPIIEIVDSDDDDYENAQAEYTPSSYIDEETLTSFVLESLSRVNSYTQRVTNSRRRSRKHHNSKNKHVDKKQKLPRQIYQVTTCPVCLSDFDENIKTISLVCGHIICSVCFENSALLVCPMCRAEIIKCLE